VIRRPAPQARRARHGQHAELSLGITRESGSGHLADLPHRQLGEHGRGDGRPEIVWLLAARDQAQLHHTGQRWIVGHTHPYGPRPGRIYQLDLVSEVRELGP
jgi:hypothetical protein